MAILGQCKIADTITGQQQLVDLVAEQCNFSQSFNPADQEHLDRILICMKHALPYFSVISFQPATSLMILTVTYLQTQVKSTAFVSYICDQLLPHRATISSTASIEQKLDIFKLLAELSTNCGPLELAPEKIQIVYDTLLVSPP